MTRQQSRHLAWAVGGIGLVGTALGWTTNPAAFPHAWLAAFTVWLAWPLGCLGLLLIHALTGGPWGYVLRAQFIAGIRTLGPLLVPAAIPWLLTLHNLYPWAQPGAAAHLPNGFYLNRPFFFLRALVYLSAWLGLRALALRALRAPKPDAALARIAPGGLIVLALTITFSAIDLTESLDPNFNSSVYGLVTIAEMALFALSIAMLAASLERTAAFRESSDVMGKLLIGLVLWWAYLDFMQLLIAWQSNLPTDAAWYLARGSGGWGTTAMSITAAHFVLPWCALIWPQIRRSRNGIALVACVLAFSEIVRTWWLVLPASQSAFAPVDVAAMLCLLGVGAALSLGGPHVG